VAIVGDCDLLDLALMDTTLVFWQNENKIQLQHISKQADVCNADVAAKRAVVQEKNRQVVCRCCIAPGRSAVVIPTVYIPKQPTSPTTTTTTCQ
jgi:hypothetical protein